MEVTTIRLNNTEISVTDKTIKESIDIIDTKLDGLSSLPDNVTSIQQTISDISANLEALQSTLDNLKLKPSVGSLDFDVIYEVSEVTPNYSYTHTAEDHTTFFVTFDQTSYSAANIESTGTCIYYRTVHYSTTRQSTIGIYECEPSDTITITGTGVNGYGIHALIVDLKSTNISFTKVIDLCQVDGTLQGSVEARNVRIFTYAWCNGISTSKISIGGTTVVANAVIDDQTTPRRLIQSYDASEINLVNFTINLAGAYNHGVAFGFTY